MYKKLKKLKLCLKVFKKLTKQLKIFSKNVKYILDCFLFIIILNNSDY
jgi:hypothetical protein